MGSVFSLRQRAAFLLLVASAVGCALAVFAYVTPLTGVNGSLGALIVIGACVALAIGAFGLAFVEHGVWHILLWVLLLFGLIGTAVAGLFLHRWWIAVALGVGLIGLVIDLTLFRRPARNRREERSA